MREIEKIKKMEGRDNFRDLSGRFTCEAAAELTDVLAEAQIMIYKKQHPKWRLEGILAEINKNACEQEI